MGLAEQLVSAWEHVLQGVPGVFSLELRSGGAVVASREADAPHYPASTIKLAVLLAFLRDRTAGLPSALDPVVVHDRFPSAVGGAFQLDQSGDQDDETWAMLGREVDLLELADRMVTLSSNIATDLIVERIGLESVRRLLVDRGLASELRVDRLIGDDAAEAAGTTNSVTASALAQLMASVATGEDGDSATALGLLARQTHRDMIPAGLPPDVWSASKGGWVPGVKHDVALVRPPSAPEYVLAVCTTSPLPHTEGLRLVAALSAVTWKEWVGWHAS
ncbi:MAG: serine hydrolase [Actinobacteria bacterium]|nr:serine hydrolase [Actinomycetota bacterium]